MGAGHGDIVLRRAGTDIFVGRRATSAPGGRADPADVGTVATTDIVIEVFM
jgi:hypothetical protein